MKDFDFADTFKRVDHLISSTLLPLDEITITLQLPSAMHSSRSLSLCLLIGLAVISTTSAQFSLQSLGLPKLPFKLPFGRQESTLQEPSEPIQEETTDQEILITTPPPTPVFQIVTSPAYTQQTQNLQVEPQRRLDVVDEVPSQIQQYSQVQQSQGQRRPARQMLGQQRRQDSSEESSEIQQVSQIGQALQVEPQQLQTPPPSFYRPQVSPPRFQQPQTPLPSFYRPQVQPPRYEQSNQGQSLHVEPQVELIQEIQEETSEIQQLTQTQRPILVTQSLQQAQIREKPEILEPIYITTGTPVLIQQQPQAQQPALIQQKPAPIRAPQCCAPPAILEKLDQVLSKLETLNEKVAGLSSDLAKAQETIESQSTKIEQLQSSSQQCSQKGEKSEPNLQEFARASPTLAAQLNDVESVTVREVVNTPPPMYSFVKG